MKIKINLSLDRECNKCGANELDHPCKVHLLYYTSKSGVEKIYDWYETESMAEKTVKRLITSNGYDQIMNILKIRYSYEDCDGEYK